MKQKKYIDSAFIACFILAGFAGLLVIAGLAHSYGALGEAVPAYLAPWGGSWGDRGRSLFYVFRLPVMALCLQIVLLGFWPKRADGWPDAALPGMRALLAGLSVAAMSQFSLNPYFTMMQFDPVLRGIALCITLVLGLALAISGYVALHRALKPLCDADSTPYSMLLKLMFSIGSRRRALIIAAGAIFMVLLIIPSL